jgi:L-aspartate oxidase
MSSLNVKPLNFRRRQSQDRAVIIGGGLAGLFTALKLAPLPVTILTPRPLGRGASSAWAQGGIAAAMGEGDSYEAHAADTIRAGAGLSDKGIANIVAREAAARVHDLLQYGVPFDKDLEGRLTLSREAAHSVRRIVRVNGDRAGQAVMAALIATAAQTPSISVLENVEAVELQQDGGRVCGVFVSKRDQDGPAVFIPARATVLATGGIGHLYSVTTNPAEAKGHGIALAALAGAVIADAEFVQFHPTAFDVGLDPAPLASEALRGEGALLVNGLGQRFMQGLHPDGELAPRDIVARAVHREINEGRGAFLDCRGLGLARDFPTAYAAAVQANIDPARQPLPIAPAAHYHMGGVLTDARGRTTLSGLWACGEAASTGMHGANRLASNALLEAVVFGARVAEDISAEAPMWYALGKNSGTPPVYRSFASANTAVHAIGTLRKVMSAHAGVERSAGSLQRALGELQSLRAQNLPWAVQAMALTALFVVTSALLREESRGAHQRLDFPTAKAEARHNYMTLNQALKAEAEALQTASSQFTAAKAAKGGVPLRRAAG